MAPIMMLAISLLVYITVAQCRPQSQSCTVGWNEIEGRCFIYQAQPRTWTQAQLFCQTMGGNLASIHSVEEHKRIQQLTTPNRPRTWIGGSDCQESGAWFWIDGSPMSFHFWCPTQPDNTKECCLQMNTGDCHCWDDVNCNSFLPSVCVKNLKT